MREPSSPPAAAGVLFPELAGTLEPAPPVRGRGSRTLRTLARVVLWSLIAAGALRGLLPVTDGPGPATAAEPSGDRREAAVATAFLREYLTVGDDRTARARRLGRFAVAGVDLRGPASVPHGVAQYVDLVVAAGSSPVAGGTEVTVLAHVLQIRSGAYRDGGTLAFVVPLAVRPEGVAVRGRPRPTTLPIASGPPLPRRQAVPTVRSRLVGRMARPAVVPFLAADMVTVARPGGGRGLSVRQINGGGST